MQVMNPRINIVFFALWVSGRENNPAASIDESDSIELVFLLRDAMAAKIFKEKRRRVCGQKWNAQSESFKYDNWLALPKRRQDQSTGVLNQRIRVEDKPAKNNVR